ncbi:hypothetical protein BQ8794_90195 [Mesorhizobium prunaredense]|uniref:Uncharacterized protein n=1 Tax=Mesorhizobium prunaredense TaxID=1631249 RepID=A0A1R3VJD8_9HYPH|nr:hypothetical protein BQ8794_90195 [Mesorhizobium prunaredense]
MLGFPDGVYIALRNSDQMRQIRRKVAGAGWGGILIPFMRSKADAACEILLPLQVPATPNLQVDQTTVAPLACKNCRYQQRRVLEPGIGGNWGDAS